MWVLPVQTCDEMSPCHVISWWLALVVKQEHAAWIKNWKVINQKVALKNRTRNLDGLKKMRAKDEVDRTKAVWTGFCKNINSNFGADQPENPQQRAVSVVFLLKHCSLSGGFVKVTNQTRNADQAVISWIAWIANKNEATWGLISWFPTRRRITTYPKLKSDLRQGNLLPGKHCFRPRFLWLGACRLLATVKQKGPAATLEVFCSGERSFRATPPQSKS